QLRLCRMARVSRWGRWDPYRGPRPSTTDPWTTAHSRAIRPCNPRGFRSDTGPRVGLALTRPEETMNHDSVKRFPRRPQLYERELARADGLVLVACGVRDAYTCEPPVWFEVRRERIVLGPLAPAGEAPIARIERTKRGRWLVRPVQYDEWGGDIS